MITKRIHHFVQDVLLYYGQNHFKVLRSFAQIGSHIEIENEWIQEFATEVSKLSGDSDQQMKLIKMYQQLIPKYHQRIIEECDKLSKEKPTEK